jgi:hypothetical protein
MDKQLAKCATMSVQLTRALCFRKAEARWLLIEVIPMFTENLEAEWVVQISAKFRYHLLKDSVCTC